MMRCYSFESSAVGLKGPVEDPPSGSKKDLVEEPLRELCFREQSGHCARLRVTA